MNVRQYDVSVFDDCLKGEAAMVFWLPCALALAAAFIRPMSWCADLRPRAGMVATASISVALSVLLVIDSAVFAVRWGDRQFVKNVPVSIVADYMATATHDSTRVAGMSAWVIHMDEALDFGMRLTGQVALGAGYGAAHSNEPTAPADSHGAKSKDEHREVAQDREHGVAHVESSAVGQRATVAIG